ncbi:hypothetical protein BDC45DRAFT_513042 [Circinella umbellata]|nr:hypothetical protein BDC45DRAFT_513042 [Circinella umbellata]
MQSSQQHYNNSDDDDEPVVVKQTLDADQKNYEFPPRSLLQELSYLDEDIDSFFDESSFSTSESDYYLNNMNSFSGSSYRLMLSDIMDDDDEYDDDDENDMDDQQLLVDDSRLSPLQLPARASCSPRRRRARDLSCDSASTVTQIPSPNNLTTDPVGPSSFLKHQQSSPLLLSCNGKKNNNHGNQQDDFTFPKNRVMQNKVSPNDDSRQHQILSQLDSEDEFDLPIFRNESEPIMDDMSETDSDDIRYNNNHQSNHARTIIIKLSNNHHQMNKKKDRCYSQVSSNYHISDEGYEEEDEEYMDDDDELPIDSVSVFLPLSDQEQEHMVDRDMIRNAAATRIQAAWRGYQSRRRQQQLKSALKPTQRIVVDLARICNNMHGRQMSRMNERMDALEQRLREEQAMRMAFEKAMEDMTVLIDQQQKMLSDRIDGEIMMRETFEQKMLQAESRIKKEVEARNDLEYSMSQVLIQVQDMQQAQQRQLKEDAESKKTMRRKLDEALYEINILKRQQQHNNNTTKPTKAAASMAIANNTTTTHITTTSTTNNNNNNNNTRNRNKSSASSASLSSNTKASSLSSASITKASTPRTTNTSLRNTNTNTTTTTTSPSSRRRTIVPSSNKTITQVTPNSRASSRMETKRPTAVPHTSSRQSTQTLTTRRSTVHQRR